MTYKIQSSGQNLPLRVGHFDHFQGHNPYVAYKKHDFKTRLSTFEGIFELLGDKLTKNLTFSPKLAKMVPII